MMLERVQQPEDMEIGHATATQEPMSFNLVVEVATLELKESDTVRQEPVSLKFFYEVAIQTEIETIET